MPEPMEVVKGDVDIEDMAGWAKCMRRGTGKIQTCFNYMWGRWYASMPTTRGFKAKCIREVFGFDANLVKREQSKLSDLASVYRRVPPDAWDNMRPWAFYALIARFYDHPFRQRYWVDKKLEKGDMGVMHEELIELGKIKAVEHRRQKPKPLVEVNNCKVVNYSTGEVIEIRDWNKEIESRYDDEEGETDVYNQGDRKDS